MKLLGYGIGMGLAFAFGVLYALGSPGQCSSCGGQRHVLMSNDGGYVTVHSCPKCGTGEKLGNTSVPTAWLGADNLSSE